MPSQSVNSGANCSALSPLDVLVVGSQSTCRVLLRHAVPTENGKNAEVIVGETPFSWTFYQGAGLHDSKAAASGKGLLSANYLPRQGNQVMPVSLL